MVSLSQSTVFHSRDADDKPPPAHDHSSHHSLEVVREIHKRFADFLFSKAEYSSAVDHYIKTISYLSPSYVILKFMDPSHIIHLTRYLQAIHDSKIATSSHSSLLLNCYSKLKDEEKINELVRQGSFDIENGIRICKTAGYFSQALELAKRAALHDSVISLLLEDIQDASQVISYIAKLDPDSIKQTFQKYGSSLIKQLPKDSTDILVFLCTTEPQVHPEDFVFLYVDSKTWCIEFLERVLSSRFTSSIGEYDSRYQMEREKQSRSIVFTTVFELYLENCQISSDVFIYILKALAKE